MLLYNDKQVAVLRKQIQQIKREMEEVAKEERELGEAVEKVEEIPGIVLQDGRGYLTP